MTELERALRAGPAPDPDAQERAWRLAHAAYLRRPAPSGRRHRRRRALAGLGASVAAVCGLAVALTPAGGSVVRLVAPSTPTRPAAAPEARAAASPGPALPRGTGRLLVLRDGWATVVERGGAARRLARADEATFSAFGRYVATARGPRITVYALDGRRVWSLVEPTHVHGLRWSPDGLRLAYRAGDLLRVVDGNGEAPRTLGRVAGALALAWRPGPDAVLAVVRAPRVLTLVDVATGREVARLRAPAGTTGLSWSGDGRRLVAVGPSELRVLSRGGALLQRRTPPAGTTFVAAALSPRSHHLAVVRRGGDGDELSVGGRVRVTVPHLGAPVWSSDGRWLAAERGGDGWVFVPADPRRPPIVHRVRATTIAGWCCAARSP